MHIERLIFKSSLRRFLYYLHTKKVHRSTHRQAQNEVEEAFAVPSASRRHAQRKYISRMQLPRAEAPETTCKSLKVFCLERVWFLFNEVMIRN